MRRVPITLMANLATLRDLGRAYWVHKYDSNWIAKICGHTHIHNWLKKKKTVYEMLWHKTRASLGFKARKKEREESGGWEALPAFPTGAGPEALGWSPDRYGWRGCLPQLEAAELEGNPDSERGAKGERTGNINLVIKPRKIRGK